MRGRAFFWVLGPIIGFLMDGAQITSHSILEVRIRCPFWGRAPAPPICHSLVISVTNLSKQANFLISREGHPGQGDYGSPSERSEHVLLYGQETSFSLSPGQTVSHDPVQGERGAHRRMENYGTSLVRYSA